MKNLKNVVNKYNSMSLILRILCGLIIGVVLAFIVPGVTWIAGMGSLFVGALKAMAPILVFVLVASSLMQKGAKMDKRFAIVIFLYMISTFLAALIAVIASFLFPQTLVLDAAAESEAIPSGIMEVLSNLMMKLVANPIEALSGANYIGILFWAILLGLAMKSIAKDETIQGFTDLAAGVSQIIRWIINLAPFGICGLIYDTVSENGLSVFSNYGKLLILLVSCMLFVALLVDPLISWIMLRRNPYPLVLKCLKESGVTAFFTRSSAANIPINMNLCESVGLDKDFYSVSIPLGATINMDGAAVTISIMALAAANTMGVAVDFPTALILSVLSAIGACGASGVAGGSLMLIPMACSLFGISNDVAMQVVGVGFIIGVVQDSLETALNSSGDAMFTITAEFYEWIKQGKELPDFMGGKKK
jgi:serine/threonine transporter